MGGTRADKWLSVIVLRVFAVTRDFPFRPKGRAHMGAACVAVRASRLWACACVL